MGTPGILVDWVIKEPAKWGELLATAEKLQQRYGCPIWVAADKSLVPLAIMNERYLGNNYRWLQRHIDKAREHIIYYQEQLAQANHRMEMEYAGVHYQFQVYSRETNQPTGETMTLGQQLTDAQECLDSWLFAERWMMHSVDVLRQWASDHKMTVYEEIV